MNHEVYELIWAGIILFLTLFLIRDLYPLFKEARKIIQKWREKSLQERIASGERQALFAKHTEIHQKFIGIKSACLEAEADRIKQEQQWLKEQEELRIIVEDSERKEKAKRTRTNNIRKFEKLFGFRPALIRKQPNGGHLSYWQDVHIGLARLAGHICNEHRRVLRRFPSDDDCAELTSEYENARLLIKRYCKDLYVETRPWSEQLKLLTSPPARPARVKGNLIPEKSSASNGSRSKKRRNGHRQHNNSLNDSIIDAVVVGEPNISSDNNTTR